MAWRSSADPRGTALEVGIVNGLEELEDVAVVDRRHALLELRHEVLERGRLTPAVERPASIRQQDERDAARFQDAMHLVNQTDRLRDVLEHVARDDEVLALTGQRLQAIRIEVTDVIRGREYGGWPELRKQLAILLRRPSVHVGNRDTWEGDGKRVMARTDLDARACQVSAQQPTSRHHVALAGEIRHGEAAYRDQT